MTQFSLHSRLTQFIFYTLCKLQIVSFSNIFFDTLLTESLQLDNSRKP